MSGSQELVDKYGDWFTWSGAPRAKIFARDHDKVVDLSSMIKLMRYGLARQWTLDRIVF